MAVATVRKALASLCDTGLLLKTSQDGADRYVPTLERKPVNSVFVPAAVWQSVAPGTLAYYVVQAAMGHGCPSKSNLCAVEAGRIAGQSRRTAYRNQAALVASGVLAVPKSTTASAKNEQRAVPKSSHKDGVSKYGNSNTDKQLSDNTHSVGVGVAMYDSGTNKEIGWVGVSQKAGEAKGRTDGKDGLFGSLGDGVRAIGRASQREAVGTVPTRQHERTADAPTGTVAVRGGVAQGSATLAHCWAELRARAGRALCLRPTVLATGLPSIEEALLTRQFAELRDEDRTLAAFALVGDWIASGGLAWFRERNASPWRYVARNLADCLSRAAEWGRKGLPGARAAGPALDEDESMLTEQYTLRLLEGGRCQ